MGLHAWQIFGDLIDRFHSIPSRPRFQLHMVECAVTGRLKLVRCPLRRHDPRASLVSCLCHSEVWVCQESERTPGLAGGRIACQSQRCHWREKKFFLRNSVVRARIPGFREVGDDDTVCAVTSVTSLTSRGSGSRAGFEQRRLQVERNTSPCTHLQVISHSIALSLPATSCHNATPLTGILIII